MSAEIAASRRSQWQPVLPVPSGTPSPSLRHHVRGEPMRVFTYRDAAGQVLGYVCRFQRSAGGIQELTLTWCRNASDGSHAWRWLQFPAKRPLYGLDRLAQDERRSRIVLLVHEEWCVEELRTSTGAEFEHYEPIAWPGGRTKIGDVDWSPLRGKAVFVWMPHSAARFRVARGDPQAGELIPLDRQPWRVTARRLQETLREFGALVPCIIEAATTEELPDGWDAVHALNEQWSAAKLADWMRARLGSAAEVADANKLATPPEASGAGVSWMRSLIRKDNVGALLPELHNVRQILTHHEDWVGVIYLDTFAHRVMKAKPPPFAGCSLGEWADTDDSMGADWMASVCGVLKLRTSMVAEAVGMVAKLHARNPLEQYLRGLKWDRVPRLDSWLRVYLNAGPFTEDMSAAHIERLDAYLRIVGSKWLMGAVKRVLEPGCKFDYMLILEGQQGLGKSSAAAIIGGPWAMDSPFSLASKEGQENIIGKWIVEIPELDAFNKADSTAAKSFFSRREDRFRMPYGKRSADYARNCVFIGTTNEHEYLRDPTGNRRYWPVQCDRAGGVRAGGDRAAHYDRAALERDRDQLLAEAVHRMLAGEQIWPTREEERLFLRYEQRRREVPDPWTGKLAAWLIAWPKEPEAMTTSGRVPITRELILAKCFQVEPGRIDERGMAVRVGRAMARLGWERVEDKSLPERFRYEKRQSGHEDDE